MEFKRVRCLYRVSTLKQLDKNDKDSKNEIPMQRIVCTEFIATKPDWKLDKEYIEKGVSGYNKKLEDRDVLQEIKQDALNKEFDVLLVFMFDRLGRREDETPFIVEWFVSQGIEIWSTQEGQQKFDSRADKLINYIRYWQSGGESEKTSIRVRTKQKQMVEEGINIFSVPPYGYRLVKTGIFSKRGVERKTYEIIPSEAEVIKIIFNLFTEEGYGGIRIAKYLNERGYKTHKGFDWSYSTINNMLRNPIYIGYLSYNKTSVPIGGGKRKRTKDWVLSNESNPSFRIISDEQFEKAQKIKQARKQQNIEHQQENSKYFPYQTKSPLLFAGFTFCGGCGSKMQNRASKRGIKTVDGKEELIRYYYYACTNAQSGRECTCKQKTYKSNIIETPVLNEIYKFLDSFEEKDLADEIKRIKSKTENAEGNQIKELDKEIKSYSNKLESLKDEVVKSITGESDFSKELLAQIIEQHQEKISDLEKQKCSLEELHSKKQLEFEQLTELKKMIPNWKEEFVISSTEQKKMILSSIIEKVTVYHDKIEVKLKMSINEFLKTAEKVTIQMEDTSKKCTQKDFRNISNRRTSFD